MTQAATADGYGRCAGLYTSSSCRWRPRRSSPSGWCRIRHQPGKRRAAHRRLQPRSPVHAAAVLPDPEMTSDSSWSSRSPWSCAPAARRRRVGADPVGGARMSFLPMPGTVTSSASWMQRQHPAAAARAHRLQPAAAGRRRADRDPGRGGDRHRAQRPRWSRANIAMPGWGADILLAVFLGFSTSHLAAAALALAIPPILVNAAAGVPAGVDPASGTRPTGVGMTTWQQVVQVEVPMAMPLILSGCAPRRLRCCPPRRSPPTSRRPWPLHHRRPRRAWAPSRRRRCSSSSSPSSSSRFRGGFEAWSSRPALRKQAKTD